MAELDDQKDALKLLKYYADNTVFMGAGPKKRVKELLDKYPVEDMKLSTGLDLNA